MNYEDTERELAQLFHEIQYIEGTFPPVYLVEDVLIGYDKLEQIKVLAIENQPASTPKDWGNAFQRWLIQLAGKSSIGYNNNNLKESSQE
jgi:hypothetical protein